MKAIIWFKGTILARSDSCLFGAEIAFGDGKKWALEASVPALGSSYSSGTESSRDICGRFSLWNAMRILSPQICQHRMRVVITSSTTAKYTNPTPYLADLDHGSRCISAASAAVVEAVTGTFTRLTRDTTESHMVKVVRNAIF